jgi:hypothetical protein
VITGSFAGGFPDGIESIGVGDADLAGLFHDLGPGVIVDPAGLVGEETEHIYDFGFSIFDLFNRESREWTRMRNGSSGRFALPSVRESKNFMR